MAQVSRATFTTDTDTDLANNTIGGISEAEVRDRFDDLADSTVWYDEGEAYDPTTLASPYWLSTDAVPAGDKYVRTVTGKAEEGISEDGVEIGVLPFFLFNGGLPITTSITDEIISEFAGTPIKMIGVIKTSDGSASSVTVSIRKCTTAQWDQGTTHPVVGDEISGAEDFVIAAAHNGTKTTGFSSWTAAGVIARGDLIQFVINSTDADILSVKGQIEYRKS